VTNSSNSATLTWGYETVRARSPINTPQRTPVRVALNRLGGGYGGLEGFAAARKTRPRRCFCVMSNGPRSKPGLRNRYSLLICARAGSFVSSTPPSIISALPFRM